MKIDDDDKIVLSMIIIGTIFLFLIGGFDNWNLND